MKTLWRCANCETVSSCSAIILSSTVIRSEWRRFSASTIFPSEATIASYVVFAGRFGDACERMENGIAVLWSY
ncbi:hypothetical protein FKM82_022715 [Ascaphus truei]